jgi:hypothetical protein
LTPALRYQVKPPLCAPAGRGTGRTTGRRWVWRPVRLWAVMVAGLLCVFGLGGLLAAQAATAGLLGADGLGVVELKQ